MKTKRLVGLDVFRVIAALVVFFFHSLIHIGCRFGFFSDFAGLFPSACSGFSAVFSAGLL